MFDLSTDASPCDLSVEIGRISDWNDDHVSAHLMNYFVVDSDDDGGHDGDDDGDFYGFDYGYDLDSLS